MRGEGKGWKAEGYLSALYPNICEYSRDIVERFRCASYLRTGVPNEHLQMHSNFVVEIDKAV